MVLIRFFFFFVIRIVFQSLRQYRQLVRLKAELNQPKKTTQALIADAVIPKADDNDISSDLDDADDDIKGNHSPPRVAPSLAPVTLHSLINPVTFISTIDRSVVPGPGRGSP